MRCTVLLLLEGSNTALVQNQRKLLSNVKGDYLLSFIQAVGEDAVVFSGLPTSCAEFRLIFRRGPTGEAFYITFWIKCSNSAVEV